MATTEKNKYDILYELSKKSFQEVIEKYLMDFKYLSAYKMLFFLCLYPFFGP